MQRPAQGARMGGSVHTHSGQQQLLCLSLLLGSVVTSWTPPQSDPSPVVSQTLTIFLLSSPFLPPSMPHGATRFTLVNITWHITTSLKGRPSLQDKSPCLHGLNSFKSYPNGCEVLGPAEVRCAIWPPLHSTPHSVPASLGAFWDQRCAVTLLSLWSCRSHCLERHSFSRAL